MSKLPPDANKTIARLYPAMTLEALGRMFGVTKQAIHLRVKWLQLRRPESGAWKRLRAEEPAVAEYLRTRKSVREIASEYGVARGTAFRWLHQRGIALENRGHPEGAQNTHWKGDDAGWLAMQHRVMRARGKPQRCEACGYAGADRRYEWVNMTGKRGDVNDYRRLCRRCRAARQKQHKQMEKVS